MTSDFFIHLETLSGVAAPTMRLPAGATFRLAQLLDFLNRRMKGKWDPAVDPVRAEMGTCFWGASSRRAERDLAFKSRPAVSTLTDTIAYLRDNHPDLKDRLPRANL